MVIRSLVRKQYEPTLETMKTSFTLIGLGIALGVLSGCSSPDREDPRAATIGATARSAHTGNDVRPVHIGTPEFDSAQDREIASEGFTDFNALTPQERSILRARAREARDDPDDYLEHLTEAEKANLRERAQRLEN